MTATAVLRWERAWGTPPRCPGWVVDDRGRLRRCGLEGAYRVDPGKSFLCAACWQRRTVAK